FFKFNNFLYCDGTRSLDIAKAVGARNVEGKWGTAPGAAKTGSYDIFVSDYRAEYKVLPPLPFITNAYDATAVIGLGAYAAKAKGKYITSKNIRDELRKVANPPGEVIKPGEFKKAFQWLNQGKDINYEGAAGSVDFDEYGDVVTPIEVWRFRKGDMVTMRVEMWIPPI
ncbi:MAG: amino acid ABC transporter substrate-binding protein, partial [Deltaproteobacteria bacterium]